MSPVSNAHVGIFRLSVDPGPWVGREGRARRKATPREDRLPGFKNKRRNNPPIPSAGAAHRYKMPAWALDLEPRCDLRDIAKLYGVGHERARQYVVEACRSFERELRRRGIRAEDVLG